MKKNTRAYIHIHPHTHTVLAWQAAAQAAAAGVVAEMMAGHRMDGAWATHGAWAARDGELNFRTH